MKQRAVVPAALATLALGIGVGSAVAVSPSEESCTGTFTRVQGQVSCTTTETGKNPKFTDESATTGQGNISNKQETSTACEPAGSGKCPPGQFP